MIATLRGPLTLIELLLMDGIRPWLIMLLSDVAPSKPNISFKPVIAEPAKYKEKAIPRTPIEAAKNNLLLGQLPNDTAISCYCTIRII